MKIGEKYRLVNCYELNGIIVKVVRIYLYEYYLCEIVDKSLLNNPEIKQYFNISFDDCINSWYRNFNQKSLKPLRKEKLKRLLK